VLCCFSAPLGIFMAVRFCFLTFVAMGVLHLFAAVWNIAYAYLLFARLADASLPAFLLV